MRQISHLSIRVAWHDAGWNGAVCANPSQNSFCATLDRIREGKSDEEDKLASLPFDRLTQDQLPPCKAESGFFMSPRPWVREFEHPYTSNKKCAEPPHAEHLIHRTETGHMVRSKSELVIANLLHREGIAYQYEQPMVGETAPGQVHPDFTFVDAAGDRIVWEHLGMMDDPDYVRGWNWKLEWYRKNGFSLGETLFTTEEQKGKGLDMEALKAVAAAIKVKMA